MKKLLSSLTLSILALTGCASGGNQAYQAAHDSAAKRGIVEAQARADADKTLALAVASAAKSCESDVCRMGAMLTFANMKAAAGAAIQSAAPAIAAPVNEALEWAKILVPSVVAVHANQWAGVLGAINSTKGAADKDTASLGINAMTIANPFATSPVVTSTVP